MEKCKFVNTLMATNGKLSQNDGVEKVDPSIYWSLVGYLPNLTHTRHDITQDVNMLSRFMSYLRKLHLPTAKRILHYLQSTKNSILVNE